MSFLEIKEKATKINDFEKKYSNGLNILTIQRFERILPSFYTDFISGTANVTSFKLQVLNKNDARMGCLAVDSSSDIITTLIKSNIISSKYQLYFKSQDHLVHNLIYRYEFMNNGKSYTSAPFTVVDTRRYSNFVFMSGINFVLMSGNNLVTVNKK